MPKAIKKAGIGLIIPQKLIHKKGKKNFEKGKKMLGPLMGMMKKGGYQNYQELTQLIKDKLKRIWVVKRVQTCIKILC